jgi:hypothetical protein
MRTGRRGRAVRRVIALSSSVIFDVITDESGAITQVFYNYEINGVEYESSQALDPEQRLRSTEYFPGASVTVRFNPRQPSNSVVV